MDISRITEVILKNCKKNQKDDQFNHKKFEFPKKMKGLQFSMVQGSLNPNITFLGEKL